MTFTREVNVLYMLKKNGYYCFIHEAKSGSLTNLNGGALKRLEEKDINYYYAHMDEIISYIEKPFDKYMSIQQSISEEIKNWVEQEQYMDVLLILIGTIIFM